MPRKAKYIIRFTKEVIENLVPPATGRVEWYDEEVAGLVCRVSYTGTRAFYWLGRAGRKFNRVKVGEFPAMAVAAARAEGKRLIGLASQGQKVRSKKQGARDEWTLQELFDWYLENYSKPHKKTWERDERQFKRQLAKWGNRLVSDISKEDVIKEHVSLGEKSGKYAANKFLELLGSLYRVGGDFMKAHIPCGDPTHRVRRFPQEERERFLDEEELPKFLDAVDQLPEETTRDFFRLCLWTGARRSNVAGMRWDAISLKTGIWIVPGDESKNGKPMNLALSQPALAILNRRKETATSDFVLPGHGRSGHFTCPRNALARVLKTSGLSDVRVHDLRRTLGSWMAIDTPLQTIGKQLGHKSLKSTQIYARLATKALKNAVDSTTSQMLKTTEKKPEN